MEKCRIRPELNTSPSVSSFTDHVFPSFDRKNTGPIGHRWTSKWLIPRRHNKKININKDQRSFPEEAVIKNT